MQGRSGRDNAAGSKPMARSTRAPNRRGRVTSTAEKLLFLSDALNLGEAGAIERIETHFAWVFLGSRFAYKLRKPVRYHGLDTLAPESRRVLCEAELRLNADLAAGIYLDVIPLTRSAAGKLQLDGIGEPLDWLVKMRRLPRARMLDTLIRGAAVRPSDLGPLAHLLCHFYASAQRESISGAVYCGRLSARVTANRVELQGSRGSKQLLRWVRAIARLQEEFIVAHSSLLAERAESGHILDCHGDLRPEHVCLGPPVRVIDRLEFDRGLRLLDPLEELCFFALECGRLGAPAVGDWLLGRCAQLMGVPASAYLIAFYTSLQATTRAVLRVWRLAEGSRPERTRWRYEIRDYLQRALTAIRAAASASRDLPGSAAPHPRESMRATPPVSRPRRPAGSERNPSRRFRR